MLVNIDKETFIDMLVNRVKFWTQDEKVVNLFEKMYENLGYAGYFISRNFDVNMIVDNDYTNYCYVIEEDDENFEEIKKVYKEQGLGDCSCEIDCADFIEAVDNEEEPTMFLIRY